MDKGMRITLRNYHQMFSPVRKKVHCEHGKRIGACSECYKKELKEKGVSS